MRRQRSRIRAMYRLAVIGLPPGWALESIRLDTKDVTDSGVELFPGARMRGLEIRLTDQITEISGSVADAQGTPCESCTVVAFSENEKLWGDSSRYLRARQSDRRGAFDIDALPPGAYYLVASSDVDAATATQPEYLTQAMSRATRVSIQRAEKKSVNVVASPPAR